MGRANRIISKNVLYECSGIMTSPLTIRSHLNDCNKTAKAMTKGRPITVVTSEHNRLDNSKADSLNPSALARRRLSETWLNLHFCCCFVCVLINRFWLIANITSYLLRVCFVVSKDFNSLVWLGQWLLDSGRFDLVRGSIGLIVKHSASRASNISVLENWKILNVVALC